MNHDPDQTGDRGSLAQQLLRAVKAGLATPPGSHQACVSLTDDAGFAEQLDAAADDTGWWPVLDAQSADADDGLAAGN